MVQERAAFFKYRETCAHLQGEYGLPPKPAPEETARRHEVGAAEAFRVGGVDEIAHHCLFLQPVLTHLKHMPPGKGRDVMQHVLTGFRMSSLRLILIARNFIHAVAKTGIHPAGRHLKFIYNPVPKSMGLKDNAAVNRAAFITSSSGTWCASAARRQSSYSGTARSMSFQRATFTRIDP